MLQDPKSPVNPKETTLMTHPDASIWLYNISKYNLPIPYLITSSFPSLLHLLCWDSRSIWIRRINAKNLVCTHSFSTSDVFYMTGHTNRELAFRSINGKFNLNEHLLIYEFRRKRAIPAHWLSG